MGFMLIDLEIRLFRVYRNEISVEFYVFRLKMILIH